MTRHLRVGVRRWLAFFNGHISPSFGTPCCKYGQEGKPMALDKAQMIFETLRGDLPFWNLSPDGTRLVKWVYLNDYYQAGRIIEEILTIDRQETRNTPSLALLNGDLLKIELISPSIQGLSSVDFELALKLNSVDFERFGGWPLPTDRNYRAEVRVRKNEIANRRVMDEIRQQKG